MTMTATTKRQRSTCNIEMDRGTTFGGAGGGGGGGTCCTRKLLAHAQLRLLPTLSMMVVMMVMVLLVVSSTLHLLPTMMTTMTMMTTITTSPASSPAAGSSKIVGVAVAVEAFVLIMPPSSSSAPRPRRTPPPLSLWQSPSSSAIVVIDTKPGSSLRKTRRRTYRSSPPSRRCSISSRIHHHAQTPSDEDVVEDSAETLAEEEGDEETVTINLDDSTTGLPTFTYFPPSSDSSSSEEKADLDWPSLPESTYTQVMQSLDLKQLALQLRQEYDRRFEDPRQPNNDRFCWDPWYVQVGDGLKNKKEENMDTAATTTTTADQQQPQQQVCLLPGEQDAINSQTQYSLKRIQANNFFDETQFSDLVDQVTSLGRSVGLTSITPPWMSLYTHGDQQNFHTDAPHGPLAFVFSLCLDDNTFVGGETMMIRSQILDMWRDYDPSRGLELNSIIRMIPPTPLGKCVVFDPRVPHGVNVVDGTQDPRKGRVVIHGWFNSPEVCWFGPWTEPEVEEMNGMLEDALGPLVETLGTGEIGRVVGFLACKIDISESGYVDEVRGVCDTLQADYDDFRGLVGYDSEDRPVLEDAVSDIKLTIYESLKNLYFEQGTSGRSVVVPFAFE